MVELGGRPLIEWPLKVARAAGLDAVVVAKRGTALPDVTTWLEPDEPTHPLLGLVTALEHGVPIVAVACDQPWLTPALLRTLADHDRPAIAVEREPFPGRYEPLQLPVLREALAEEASLRATLGRLQPAVLDWPREEVASVNTREELLAAAARHAAGGDDARGAGGDDAAAEARP